MEARKTVSKTLLPLVLLWFGGQAGASTPLASGLLGASGSTVGPDGAIYVTEGWVGRVSRIDPETGATSTVAQGLPAAVLPIGGAMDVAFLDDTAYVLVSLVGFPFGPAVDGIYRIDGPGQFTVIADIGTFALQNPPQTSFALPQGVQYAMEAYRGGFLVTDGHHNRVLRVRLDGSVSVAHAFGNIVPTGLDIWGDTVFIAQAGPIPHLPADGKVVAVESRSGDVTEIAAGAPLLVDVERGPGATLFGLAQGHWTPGQMDGAPADPNTGTLVRVRGDGGFDVVAGPLNLPTSFEVLGNDAYVVTLTGDVWRIPDIAAPPYGPAR